jgi:hypothetical protein
MTGASRFGIPAVREAVRRRVEETSLRYVAAEIPMSFSGLRSFLDGGTPQRATRARLVAWYARSRAPKAAGISREDVDAAIDLLVIYLAEDDRPLVRDRRLQEILRRLEP